jgi:S-adenosylmethionine:tRNA ribosyltransferase-isomerase
MRRADFHYELPPELIAQQPTAERAASRLLCLDSASGALRDMQFRQLPQLLRAGDLLVFNDTRVLPARVYACKPSGGRVEIMLERRLDATTALAHCRASKALPAGMVLALPGGHRATLLPRQGELYLLRFSSDVGEFFEAHGEIPLPPYIDGLGSRAVSNRICADAGRRGGADSGTAF